MYKIDGKNYQPQLVTAGFLNQQVPTIRSGRFLLISTVWHQFGSSSRDGKSVPVPRDRTSSERDFPNSKPQRVYICTRSHTLNKYSVYPSKPVYLCFFLKKYSSHFSFEDTTAFSQTPVFFCIFRVLGNSHSILGWLHTASPVMRHSSVGGPSFTRLKTQWNLGRSSFGDTQKKQRG